MDFIAFSLLFFISLCSADKKILHLDPGCPSTNTGKPHPLVRADVPALVTAKCRNGEKRFTSPNDVKYVIGATLNQHYVGGDCQYYKKAGVNTYHIEVAVAWSEVGRELYTKKRIYTITCSYDVHGNSTSERDKMVSAYIAPAEKQHLKGERHSTGNFSLMVVDVLNRELTDDHLHIGRLVRLKAVELSGTVKAFRALSCVVANHLTSYAILRAGCGDGIVFGKKEGFLTVGNVVYSPYFDAFKLNGSSQVRFECNFTVCESSCDGDSCRNLVRKVKRSPTDDMSDDSPGPTSQAVSPTYISEEPPVVPIGRKAMMGKPTDKSRQESSVQNTTPNGTTSSRRSTEHHKHHHHKTMYSSYLEPLPGLEHVTVILVVFACLLLLTFLISLYLCCTYEVAQLKPSLNR